MEEKIINKLRVIKKRLPKVYKYIIQYVDLKDNIVDSETLSILTSLSKIDEEITDIMYLIIDSKKS